MAGKRASSRTTSLNKQPKSSPSDRSNKGPEQRTHNTRSKAANSAHSSRANINSQHLDTEVDRCQRIAPKRRAPSGSGLSSDSSIPETPRSEESVFPSNSQDSSRSHQKRRRVEAREDQVDSFSSSSRRRQNRACYHGVIDLEGDTFQSYSGLVIRAALC